MRISNRDSNVLVDKTQIFKANNLFAENYDNRFYVVYSYGHHWPLWVFDRKENQWYGNSSKYSVSTSKHKSQSRPDVESIVYLDNCALKNLIAFAEVK